MSDPVYVYIGHYDNEDEATADLDVVRALYEDDIIRTYDVAVVAKDPDGKVHVRHEEPTEHAAREGAAVGALVGILFPPAIVGDAVGGAVAGALVAHLSHGMSGRDLKDLGEALDADDASLVVISTSEFDDELIKVLEAATYEIKKLDKADATAFERDLKSLGGS